MSTAPSEMSDKYIRRRSFRSNWGRVQSGRDRCNAGACRQARCGRARLANCPHRMVQRGRDGRPECADGVDSMRDPQCAGPSGSGLEY